MRSKIGSLGSVLLLGGQIFLLVGLSGCQPGELSSGSARGTGAEVSGAPSSGTLDGHPGSGPTDSAEGGNTSHADPVLGELPPSPEPVLPATAEDCPGVPEVPDFDTHVAPILARNCAGCHSGDSARGGFRLDRRADPAAGRSVVERFTQVLMRVRVGNMPPAPSPALDACDVRTLALFAASLSPEDDAPTCEARAASAPGELRRLTRPEYEAALRGLFGDALVAAVGPDLALLPEDRTGGFTSLARGVTAQHVEAWYTLAERVADRVATDPGLRAGLAPCLAPGGDVAACGGPLADALARRAYRRPPTAAERADLVALYDEGRAESVDEGVRLVVQAVLLAPGFLYRSEGQASAYELATRLSFATTGGPPDEALLTAVDEGRLDEPAAVEAEVARLLDTPGARVNVGRFFDELLRLDAVPPPPEALARRLTDAPAAALRQAALDEVRDFLDALVFEEAGSFQGLLASRRAIVPDAGLARLYGLAAPTGEAVSLPERAGVLTRAAVLFQQDAETHPLRRGAAVARTFLCADLAQPDRSAFPPGTFEPPPFDPHQGNRARWEAKTSPSACQGCHAQINPPGFAFERYDAAGARRTLEDIRDPSTGEVVASLPVETATRLFLDGREYPVADDLELSAVLAESRQAAACFARQWFRYSMGRAETPADACLLDDMTRTLVEGGSLLEMVAAQMQAPEMRLEAP